MPRLYIDCKDVKLDIELKKRVTILLDDFDLSESKIASAVKDYIKGLKNIIKIESDMNLEVYSGVGLRSKSIMVPPKENTILVIGRCLDIETLKFWRSIIKTIEENNMYLLINGRVGYIKSFLDDLNISYSINRVKMVGNEIQVGEDLASEVI